MSESKNQEETIEEKIISTPEESKGKEHSAPKKVKRRNFLLWSAAGIAGTGAVLGVGYSYRYTLMFKMMQLMANNTIKAKAFLVIPTKGNIQLVCARSEMGQGVRTAMPMLIAEELDVGLDQVDIIQADGDAMYGDQNTDGSRSITSFFTRLREVGAAARELLIEAAAEKWRVPASECRTNRGMVLHRTKGSIPYGELAEAITSLPLPEKPTLKSSKDFKLLGKPQKGIDQSAIVQGAAPFGIDVEIPGMVYACAARAPLPKATLKGFDDKAALKVPNVLKVIRLRRDKINHLVNDSVVVIAKNTWAAIQGKRALQVKWDDFRLQRESTPDYKNQLEHSLKDPATWRREGDAKAAEKQAEEVFSRAYHTPYLLHAQMEPLVATAHVKQDKTCEIWAPCQDPQRVQKTIASYLGVDVKKVTVHVTFLGGGFGRKSQPDFILEAVAISKQLKKPVKLQWTREDDTKHGFYHSQSFQRLSAGLDKKGYPISWHHQSVFKSLVSVMFEGFDAATPFEFAMAGSNMPYRIDNVLCETGETHASVRVGWLRSVCNIFHSFTVNSFINELADKAGIDPIEYRKTLYGKPRVIKPDFAKPMHTKRMLTVMEKTKKEFGWDKPLPKGHGKGFAEQFSFNSHVAAAMEVSVKDDNVTVHRCTITIDCGFAVNPETVRAQMEGSVAFGLSAGLYGKITLKDGAVKQSNYHDYPVLRMNEMPKVDVHIINGDPNNMGGVGEPGVPVITPALVAAIHNATGKRIHDLPVVDTIKEVV